MLSLNKLHTGVNTALKELPSNTCDHKYIQIGISTIISFKMYDFHTHISLLGPVKIEISGLYDVSS